MKILKILSVFALTVTLLTSCKEVVLEELCKQRNTSINYKNFIILLIDCFGRLCKVVFLSLNVF